MEQDEPTQVAQPMQTAGLWRSTRVKIHPKLYKLTMTGSKYSYAVTQLETHGVLHPDSHMFIQEDFYQSDPYVKAHIMTQLDRNYTAMCTHVQWSVHLSALLITLFTWGDGLQRRYASDIAYLYHLFPSHSW
jgi:hypothetical protein